jgi:hypothetical protein
VDAHESFRGHARRLEVGLLVGRDTCSSADLMGPDLTGAYESPFLVKKLHMSRRKKRREGPAPSKPACPPEVMDPGHLLIRLLGPQASVLWWHILKVRVSDTGLLVP